MRLHPDSRLLLLLALFGLLVALPCAATADGEDAADNQTAMATQSTRGDSGGEAGAGEAAESATAVSEPVIPFLPPLSVEECVELIKRAADYLPAQEGDPVDESQLPARSLSLMVKSCYNYLQYRDDLHTSLSNYEWYQLDDNKVQNDPGDEDHDTIELEPPVGNISALSLEARNGDVWLHRIRVYDVDNNERGDFIEPGQPKLLRHTLPRRQVYHLWKRTTISRIEIYYSRATRDDSSSTRVIVYGGSTNQPEYIKTALYYLGRARSQLAERDWEEARDELEDAQRNIETYLKTTAARR